MDGQRPAFGEQPEGVSAEHQIQSGDEQDTFVQTGLICSSSNQQYIHIIVVAKLDASEAKTNRFINFSTYLPENNIHCSLSFR
jgi:hypothetical protein